MTALDLPTVDPLMVRQFVPTEVVGWSGGVWVLASYHVADVGMADARLNYDEDAVDCSNRIFQITTRMLLMPDRRLAWTAFPSRRWRNLRKDQEILAEPSAEQPLLYIGNPVRLIKRPDGLHVIGRGEFVIKSGVELGVLASRVEIDQAPRGRAPVNAA